MLGLPSQHVNTPQSVCKIYK